jgi:hypothetical protein
LNLRFAVGSTTTADHDLTLVTTRRDQECFSSQLTEVICGTTIDGRMIATSSGTKETAGITIGTATSGTATWFAKAVEL